MRHPDEFHLDWARGGNSSLHEAVMRGDVEQVRKCLARRDDPGSRNWEDFTAAACAIWARQWECLAILASHPLAQLGAVDAKGRTLAHLACERGSVKALRLVEGSASPLVEDASGRDALGAAAEHGSIHCLKHLCETMDAAAADSAGLTPLMRAAAAGKVDAIRLLLPLSDMSARGPKGETPLMFAARQGRMNAVVELMARFDILAKDARGWTAARHAKDGADWGVGAGREQAKIERLLRAAMVARRRMAAPAQAESPAMPGRIRAKVPAA